MIVDLALERNILDPHVRVLLGAHRHLGLADFTRVRQGKQFIVTSNARAFEAEFAEINRKASTLLIYPVIEDFTVEVRP